MNNETERQDSPQSPDQQPDSMSDNTIVSEKTDESASSNSPETENVASTEECEPAETTEAQQEPTKEEEIAEPTTDPGQEQAPKPLPPPRKAAVISLTLKPIHLVITALFLVTITVGGVFIGMNLNRWLTDPDLDRSANGLNSCR